MILTSVFLAISAATNVAADPKVEWSAPGACLVGESYKVELTVTAGEGGAQLDSWMLTAAGFELDGKPLGARSGGKLELPAGFTVSGVVDLGPQIKTTNAFKLTHASKQGEPLSVKVLEPAPKGLNFMDEAAMPVADLSKYYVLLRTNRGDILVKFWPDVAPRHVRNYLDLSYTEFYNGTTFHRVIPGFMIQGGDPTGTGGGNGPRTLVAEFQNERKHLPGVLSAARTNDPNSASCQFFIMHKTSPHLDNQYSAFGETVFGMDVVEKIVNTPRGPGDKPKEVQRIEKAIVVKANG
jgi:peptidyl-prolyl cis-trans isomerase B (cyclophilin B)